MVIVEEKVVVVDVAGGRDDAMRLPALRPQIPTRNLAKHPNFKLTSRNIQLVTFAAISFPGANTAIFRLAVAVAQTSARVN